MLLFILSFSFLVHVSERDADVLNRCDVADLLRSSINLIWNRWKYIGSLDKV
jgi:hypothetical protein